MKLLYAIGLVLFLTLGCSKKELSEFKAISKSKFPVIIDSTIQNSIICNQKYKQWATYKLTYIGLLSDTIYTDQSLLKMGHQLFPESRYHAYLKYLNIDSLAQQKITSRYQTFIYHLGNKQEYRYKNIAPVVDTTQHIIKPNKGIYLKAYPVIFFNNTCDTIILTDSYNEIAMITEAKDSMGYWKPIEEPFEPFCFMGFTKMILPPNQIAISSVTRYSGEYKTKMRIKYRNSYSNEFFGTINYSQFTNKDN